MPNQAYEERIDAPEDNQDLLQWHLNHGCNTRCREDVHADVWECYSHFPELSGPWNWASAQAFCLERGYRLMVIGPAETPCVYPGLHAVCERFLVEISPAKSS